VGGETFGNYEVIATLGRGGMGVVYLAQHRTLARRAAIKVLIPELTRAPDIVRRFFLEARATSLIRHPGIIEVFDYDIEADGRAYIVMEYLEGETLAACLERVGALPWQTACALANRIAAAVGAAHAHGIIHRDLKPGNVFLSNLDVDVASAATERRIKILDFGLAKLLSDDGAGSRITRAGMLLGTPAYISPEQCDAAGEVDHRTDIYALGCILFEMICGQLPFAPSTFRAMLAAHMFQTPTRASTLVPAVPAWLDQLIARMLEKTAAERPASMREVADALSPAAADDARMTLLLSPEEAGQEGLQEKALRRGTLLRRPVSRRRISFGRISRRGMRFAGVVAGFVVLAAVGAVTLSRSRAGRTRGQAAESEPASEPAAATVVAAPAPITVATPGPLPVVDDRLGMAAPSPVNEPDAESPVAVVPADTSAPLKRRSGEARARRRSELPRGGAAVGTDGIVDL
jgi:serine/threonine protein kinase